ncbi:MAG TPA: toxin-antitoxin (TA) system antitoxin [Candidatus Binatia bacterium]|nr:toxin-antitoxin (TA) system antitoxin [Candidatus Binatia bacterium]
MKTVEISNSSTSLTEVVKLAREGDEVILTDGNEPVAKLVLIKSDSRNRIEGPRKLGLHRGAWQISDDFDAPLPDEFWLGQE